MLEWLGLIAVGVVREVLIKREFLRNAYMHNAHKNGQELGEKDNFTFFVL